MKFFNNIVQKLGKEKVVNMLVLFFASVVSLISFIYYLQKGYILTYADAFAHVDIARQVLDSLTPGPIQLGAVWLPLPHILMLPLIWNDFLWHTGIAGSIVSMSAYVLTVFFMYKTAKLLTKSYWSGIVAAGIIGLNANYLYLQVTPMTESVMLLTIAAFLYYLLKWSKREHLTDLIIASGFAFLSTMTRYEGWFLAIFGAAYVFWVMYKKNSYRFAESAAVLYSVVAFLGMGLWILYQLLILHDPFFFLDSPYSAKAQQEAFYKAGALPTEHNLLITLSVYRWDLIDIVGIVVLGLAAISLVSFLLKRKSKESLLYLLVAFGPPAVTIFTLFFGITIILIPQVAINHTFGQMFNVRYAIMSLPFIALVTSLIAANKKYIAMAILALVVVQALFMYKTNNVIALNDSLKGASATHLNSPTSQVAQMVYKDCRDNETLMMVGVADHDQVLITSNLPVRKFIYEGNYGYWQNALKNPAKYAGCIVFEAHNDVQDYARVALFGTPILDKNYHVLYENSSDVIYIRGKAKKEKVTIPTPTEKPMENASALLTCEYNVTTGDSLWNIAQQHLKNGKDYVKIIALNPILQTNPSVITPGEKIVIPCQ